MFFTFDKAIAAFFMPVIVFVAEAGLSSEKAVIDVITDPKTWVVAVLTAIVVYAKGNANTVYTADPDKVRAFLSERSGAVSIRALVSMVLGLILIASLSACGGSPKDLQRQTALLNCSAQATAQGLTLGSPERNTFIAACITPVIVDVIVEDINEGVTDGT